MGERLSRNSVLRRSRLDVASSEASGANHPLRWPGLLGLLAVVLLAGGAGCAQSDDVSQPETPVEDDQNEPDAEVPDEPESPDGFVSQTSFERRQMGFLEFSTAAGLEPGNPLSVLNHLERAARDPDFKVEDDALASDAWDGIFEKLHRLKDTSDFDLMYLLNLLYAYDGHPIAPAELWLKTRDAALDFKYWYTDPTPSREFAGEPVIDQMWYWSENHALIFRVNEYLAGQRFPQETFSVTGMTGEQHKARAAAAIHRWLDERVLTGFAEWHSDVYYQKDITPLLSLVEWAEDEALARRASMVLDLVFFDVALHLHEGNYGATHGRSYIKDKAAAITQDNFHSSKLLFDDAQSDYGYPYASDASLLSRARKYRLPRVLQRVAAYDGPMIDKERMSWPLDEIPDPDPDVAPPAGPPGLEYVDETNIELWWGMGAFPVWSVVPLTLEVGEREALWRAQFKSFKPLRDRVWVEDDFEETLRQTRPWLVALWPAINETVLKEVNTYTYRTSDVMLSTAQDYRKGLRGKQTHICQATLSEKAIVFTQHPGQLHLTGGDPVPADWSWRQDERGSGYWTGNSSEPRAAQHETVAIQIYAPQYAPLAGFGFPYREETHAYFPTAHFDEVVEAEPWILGRKGDGYVALFSLRPTSWRTSQPEVFENDGRHFDLVAGGSAMNVWILEVGSASEWGSFEAFKDAILAAEVSTTEVPDQADDGHPDGYDVVYRSPSQGVMEFGWHGPLTVDGVEVSIGDYPRYDNPFATIAFGQQRYEIRYEDHSLVLDFEEGTREASYSPATP